MNSLDPENFYNVSLSLLSMGYFLYGEGYLCVCVCSHECACRVSAEDIRHLGTELIGRHMSPDVGSGHHTFFPRKSSK